MLNKTNFDQFLSQFNSRLKQQQLNRLQMIPQSDFLGVFQNQNYKITKSYIQTEIPQIYLYHTKFTPKQPKYTICIIHGFGQHSTRFKLIADFYARNQFEVLMIDLRGFGYSGGARAYTELRQLQNDVIALIKTARQDLPLFLYGHSMGGLIIIKLLIDRPQLNVSGCILTSPLLGLTKNMQFGWIKRKFMQNLGDQLADFIVNSRANPTALTKKTKYLHTIFDDRLMIPFMSVKMAKYVFEGLDFVKNNSQKFTHPIIIFHGQQDTITNIEDSQNFVKKHPRPFKQIYEFRNGYHQMQHDSQKDQLLQKSLQFIRRLPKLEVLGQVNAPPIAKAPPKKNYIIKIILLMIAVFFLIRKILKLNFLKK